MSVECMGAWLGFRAAWNERASRVVFMQTSGGATTLARGAVPGYIRGKRQQGERETCRKALVLSTGEKAEFRERLLYMCSVGRSVG